VYKTRVFLSILFILFSLCLLSFSPFLSRSEAYAGSGLTLPDVSGWTCGALRTTVLDTVSGKQGVWLEREYRTTSGSKLRAVLMDTDSPKIEPDSGDYSEPGWSRRSLVILGYPATVENGPLGASVIVMLDKAYLRLESDPYGLPADDLTEAASVIMALIQSKKP